MWSLAEGSFMANVEVLFLRAQYFRGVTEKRMDLARKMYFLVKQKYSPVFFSDHRAAGKYFRGRSKSKPLRSLPKID